MWWELFIKIIKYPELEDIHKNHEVQLLSLHSTSQKSNHTSENVVQMLLELQQAWCPDHFPGEHVPVPYQPLGEGSFPNMQSEPPLTQLHAIPLMILPLDSPTNEKRSAPPPPNHLKQSFLPGHSLNKNS